MAIAIDIQSKYCDRETDVQQKERATSFLARLVARLSE
jgi:hypothetical protein